MPWAAAAAVAAAAISADAQRSASNKARDAQTRGADAATAEQRRQYDLYREDMAPYREAGYSALDQLSALLGLNGGDPSSQLRALQSDPGYQFGLQQGTNALERGAAARGGLYSGATMKALQRYGNDYASTKFNETFNRLSGVAGTGQTATQSVGQFGQNVANNISDYALQAGNARAANALNQGNILSGFANRVGGMAASYFGGGGGFGG